jgi:hypothetical protein
MVLEQEIPGFFAWLGPALVWFLRTSALVVLFAGLAAWLVQAAWAGPLEAGDRVYRGVLTGLRDLAGTSPGRVWALARLAIQEAVRRNVLVVLALFGLVVLFAGWFLDPATVEKADAVRDIAGKAHLVSDHEHRQVVLGHEASDHVCHLADHLGVERRGHLVEQHHLRPHRQCPGYGDALLLPARQTRGMLILFLDHANHVEQFLRPRPRVGPGHPQDLHRPLHAVLQRGHVRKEVEVLETHPD